MKKHLFLAALGALAFSSAHAACDKVSIHAPGTSEMNWDELAKSPTEVAAYLKRFYREKDLLNMQIVFDSDKCQMIAKALPVTATGPYAPFIEEITARSPMIVRTFPDMEGDELQNRALSSAARLIERRSKDRGEYVDIKVNQPVQEDAPVVVDTKVVATEQTKASYGALFSTLGPRYSGSDVLTGFAQIPVGEGRVDAQVSVGLPGVRKDSKGGHYASATVKASQSVPFALLEAEVSTSTYKVGGEARTLDVTGSTSKLVMSADKPLSMSTNLKVSMGATQANQKIGIADLEDNLTYGHFALAMKHQEEIAGVKYSVKGELQKGLGGKNSFNVIALQPGVQTNFSAFRVDVSASKRFNNDVIVDASIASQTSSKGTPNNETFFLGGEGRGSSFFSGTAAGPKGMSGSLKVYSPVIGTGLGFAPAVRTYAGLNGGKVINAIDQKAKVRTVEVGVVGEAKVEEFPVSYSLSVSRGQLENFNGESTYESRVNSQISVGF